MMDPNQHQPSNPIASKKKKTIDAPLEASMPSSSLSPNVADWIEEQLLHPRISGMWGEVEDTSEEEDKETDQEDEEEDEETDHGEESVQTDSSEREGISGEDYFPDCSPGSKRWKRIYGNKGYDVVGLKLQEFSDSQSLDDCTPDVCENAYEKSDALLQLVPSTINPMGDDNGRPTMGEGNQGDPSHCLAAGSSSAGKQITAVQNLFPAELDSQSSTSLPVPVISPSLVDAVRRPAHEERSLSRSSRRRPAQTLSAAATGHSAQISPTQTVSKLLPPDFSTPEQNSKVSGGDAQVEMSHGDANNSSSNQDAVQFQTSVQLQKSAQLQQLECSTSAQVQMPAQSALLLENQLLSSCTPRSSPLKNQPVGSCTQPAQMKGIQGSQGTQFAHPADQTSPLAATGVLHTKDLSLG